MEFKLINSRESDNILIWDLLVRIFHWALASFFILAYFLEGYRLSLHVHAGYTIGLLVMFRIIWGVIGSDSARFANFLVTPREALSYTVALVKGSSSHYLGHNPAGAVMIVALLSSLLLTTVSGIVLFALEGSGPLANTFVASWPGGLTATVHDLAADICLILVVMHVLGVFFSSVYYKENLAKSMITGKKKTQGKLS